MKSFIIMLLGTFIFILSTYTYGEEYNSPVRCLGYGKIKGAFGDKQQFFELYFNTNEVRGNGHMAVVNGNRFYHQGDLAGCKTLASEVVQCEGFGLGNGPKLDVIINLSNNKGSGSYFNMWARIGINYPNESNTFKFNSLECHRI